MLSKYLKPIAPTARLLTAVLCLAAVSVNQGHAHSKSKSHDAKIRVITQNQYLGANLEPLVTAPDPVAFNQALVFVLQTIGESNYPERVRELAHTIAKSRADLVGLQEMWSFGCTPASPTLTDPCAMFGPAFNDHLAATLEALQEIDAGYYEAAAVQNLTIEQIGFPLPGIPVFLDNDAAPDIFVTVRDHDVILARDSVETVPVSFLCPRPSLDGCNFENVAMTSLGGIPLNIERGFVAVDAIVKGKSYRFVNTHLEVRFPDPSNPLSRYIQSAQASELMGVLAFQPAPADSQLLLVGDINSDPEDPYPSDTSGPFLTPYQQFVSGLSLAGAVISAPYHDVWTLKSNKSGKSKKSNKSKKEKNHKKGLTCCEAADLRNEASMHERRVDMIFSSTLPRKVDARALNTKPRDKTDSGLWPSDHASVSANLKFGDRH